MSDFQIGVDQGSGKDETVVRDVGGCRVCHKSWPGTTFKKFGGFLPIESEPTVKPSAVQPLCDTCWDKPIVGTQEAQIAAAIDEAQLPKVAQLERRVVVKGIKSGTNLVQFEYVTHRGVEPLITTTVIAHFAAEGKEPTVYEYANVPVAVCEAWYAAPSKGGYFIQFVKRSYVARKVK